MVYKTYITKWNTIISNSKINTGLNPISELIYGHDTIVSRALIFFDHNKIKELIENGTMTDMSKMTHTLHIKNAGSLDFTQIHQCETSSINDNKKIRATSFDLIFFLIPKLWDRGKGFDYSKNYFNVGYYSPSPIDPKRLVSEDGANWFQCRNGIAWDEDGIYSNDTLSKEYDKWAASEPSVIIGRQHFDIGNEDISLDITNIVNEFINGEKENYGIGIAYSPLTETQETEYENYLGLLTDKTNTFFAPFVETIYNDVIKDDRADFTLNKNNKLYLYCNIGDTFCDLDINPLVTIRDDNEDIVKDSQGTLLENIKSHKFSKGVYYVDVKLSQNDFKGGRMLYDTWDGIFYQGTQLDAVELDFTLKNATSFFKIGNGMPDDMIFEPSISGIKCGERILRGDIRKLLIQAKPKYSSQTIKLIDNMKIRLYVKNGNSEDNVILWDKVNKSFIENFYIIDTNILIPQRYYVDIKISYGLNEIIHHDVIYFDIVNDVTKKYY